MAKMLTLRVHYREDDDSPSESVMTRFVPFGDDRCSALPVQGNFMRPMFYDRIIEACDVETNEVISMRELCGVRPPPGPITARPLRQSRPRGKQQGHGSEIFKGQRRKDSNEFFMRYRHDVIWNHFRNQLIGLFNGRCFACDSPQDLQLDHHVPLIRGGRREPGNIVMLCIWCNLGKWDYPPEDFYSTNELTYLAPLLAQEAEALAFTFDSERWTADPYRYLHDIGINPLLIHEVITNPDHLWSVSVTPPIQFVITADD